MGQPAEPVGLDNSEFDTVELDMDDIPDNDSELGDSNLDAGDLEDIKLEVGNIADVDAAGIVVENVEQGDITLEDQVAGDVETEVEAMLSVLARSARSWLGNIKRSHHGILLVGTVSDMLSEVNYQELTVVYPFKKG